jgi:hypothetical protein
MLTIDLTEDQVEAVAIAEVVPEERRMSCVEARQKLDQVISEIVLADEIVESVASQHYQNARSILVDIDRGLGWQELGFKSMRQLINDYLRPRLNRSRSQIYRWFTASNVQKVLAQDYLATDNIPDNQLIELSKLPTHEWKDAWDEINSKAPNGVITAKHIKKIVDERRQSKKRTVDRVELSDEQQSLRSNDKLENPNVNGSSENYYLPATIMDQSNESNQASSFASIATVVNNLITIQCSDSATPFQRKYKGCWGIINRLLESTAIVAVGGELVEYPFTDLRLVENPSPALSLVCDRITRLWQTPNLPASVKHLLETFYQRRLDFSVSDLDVLGAIESCVTQSSATYLTEEKEYSETNSQNNIKGSGVDNQIASIISTNE